MTSGRRQKDPALHLRAQQRVERQRPERRRQLRESFVEFVAAAAAVVVRVNVEVVGRGDVSLGVVVARQHPVLLKEKMSYTNWKK